MRLLSCCCAISFGLWLAGCASKPGGPAAPAGADARPSKTVIVPERALIGRIVRVNSQARTAILSFPVGMMPATDHRLNVYRGGTKVGEVKTSAERRGDNVAADIMEGECQVGDEVQDR